MTEVPAEAVEHHPIPARVADRMRLQLERIMAIEASGQPAFPVVAKPRIIGAVQPEGGDGSAGSAWPDADLVDLIASIAAGRISVEDVVDRCLAQIQRHEPQVHALARPAGSQAALLEAARLADATPVGQRPGPLHGVPFAVKDSFATARLETSAGSPLFAGWIPDRDATTVARLREEGGILVGKLAMNELGIGAAAPTRNPWNLAATPGGSSAGAGVAVALGYSPIALAADSGGSVRLPASFSGVCGFKPTFGLVGRGGVLPVSWSCDHVGIITRSPRDALLVLEHLVGVDDRDPATTVPSRELWQRVGESPPVVGFLADADLVRVDPEVLNLYQAALAAFAGAGLGLREVRLPTTPAAAEADALMIAVEAAAFYGPHLAKTDARPGPEVLDRLAAGSRYAAHHYLRALAVRQNYVAQVDRLWQDIDLLVTPTAPFAAPDRDRLAEPGVRGGMLRYLANLNMAGVPAISLPVGLTEGGLPVGVQLVTPSHTDRALLLTAEWLFRRLQPPSWSEPRPA